MLWMMFTIFATKKIRASNPVWGWHEKKRPKPGINRGTQQVGFYEEIWYLEANAEQPTIVKDLIEKIKKFMTMSLMSWYLYEI